MDRVEFLHINHVTQTWTYKTPACKITHSSLLTQTMRTSTLSLFPTLVLFLHVKGHLGIIGWVDSVKIVIPGLAPWGPAPTCRDCRRRSPQVRLSRAVVWKLFDNILSRQDINELIFHFSTEELSGQHAHSLPYPAVRTQSLPHFQQWIVPVA